MQSTATKTDQDLQNTPALKEESRLSSLPGPQPGARPRQQRTIAGLLALTLSLTGCATSSQHLTAQYVSPVQYGSYSCKQLTRESQRITQRVSELSGRLDEAASNDKVLMGVGLILFWPALFALGGTKEQEAEYKRLKGEHDAMQEAINLNKCKLPTPENAPRQAEAKAPH